MGKTSRGHHRGHEEHEEHEEHVNHEAWVIPYADMLTLLMALFLVLFAVGRTDLEKFKKLAESFRNEFGDSATQVVTLGGSGESAAGDGGAGVLAAEMTPTPTFTTVPSGGGAAEEGAPAGAPGADAGSSSTTLSPAEQALGEKTDAQHAAVAESNSLEEVRDAVQRAADAFGIGDSLNFTLDARGLVVTIVTDEVLFDSGQATLQPQGLQVLDLVGQALATVPNDVSVEGHTDDRPISNATFRDNWDLSNARATSVLRFFIERNGIPAPRLSATGHADTRPTADNATPDGAARNRRVEVVVKAAVSLDPVLGTDGLVIEDAAPATLPTEPPAPADPQGAEARPTPVPIGPAVVPIVQPDLDPGLDDALPGGAGG